MAVNTIDKLQFSHLLILQAAKISSLKKFTWTATILKDKKSQFLQILAIRNDKYY